MVGGLVIAFSCAVLYPFFRTFTRHVTSSPGPSMSCKICSSTSIKSTFTSREMMFGLRDEFEYAECGNCGCVQLSQAPDNMEKYYPKNYYSFEVKEPGWFERFAKKNIALYRWKNKGNPAGRLLQPLYPRYLRWLNPHCRIDLNSSILDIGAGSGKLLRELCRYGFRDLSGIDPYIDSDRKLADGLYLFKKEIDDVEGTFDFIMLHHSFEHMPDPGSVFTKLKALLTPQGRILIRIPVADSQTFLKYRENWAELDPPRHFFIHTTKSISILSDKNNLEISHILHDSSNFEITESEKWSRNMPSADDNNLFSAKKKKEFSRQVDKLNAEGASGRACFYLQNRDEP